MSTRKALEEIAAFVEKDKDSDEVYPGIEYHGYRDGVLELWCSDPKYIVKFVLEEVGDWQSFTVQGDYRYVDGSTCRFVRSRRAWEFREAGKVFARVCLKSKGGADDGAS